MVRVVTFALLCLSAACARAPQIDAALGPEPAGNDYPEILPFADILEADNADFAALNKDDAELEERLAALRRRASELRSIPSQQ